MRPIDKTGWRRLTIEGDAYGTARQMLLTTTGYYCAYCESPLGVDMPVEHKAAKSDADRQAGFPDQATKYSNLVLACSACNASKSSHPNQQDGIDWLKVRLPTLRNPDGIDLLYGALAAYAWPDVCKANSDAPPVPDRLKPIYSGKDETFRLFRYVRDTKSQTDLVRENVLRLSLAEAASDWAKVKQNMIWVYPNETYINQQPDSAFLLARVQNTLKMLTLNFSYPGDVKASDRRVAGRTRAGDVAQGALTTLAGAVSATGFKTGDTTYSEQTIVTVRLIRELALATGYWSTWMSVFSAITAGTAQPWQGLPAADRSELVSMTLVRYAAQDGRSRRYDFQPDPPTVFPGTDIDRVTL